MPQLKSSGRQEVARNTGGVNNTSSQNPNICLEQNVFVEIYCSCLYFCTTLLLLEPHASQLLLPTILRFGPSDGTEHLAWAVTGEADRADGCRCRRGRLLLSARHNFSRTLTTSKNQQRGPYRSSALSLPSSLLALEAVGSC